ncbi:Protein transport protein S9 plasma membrane t-SNARE, partial [Oleoguttula sp. CCFEE 5521]
MGFSRSKKDESDAGLEKQKSSLFGSRKPKSSGAPPQSTNPYAAQSSSSTNPYANTAAYSDPYAPQSQSSLSQPPTSSFGSLTLKSEASGAPPSYRGSPGQHPSDKSPVPPGGYGGGAPRYSSNGSYGQSNGYGGDPYGAGSSSRPGGYGGLGRSGSQETVNTIDQRGALFGDAPKRVAQQQQQLPSSQEQGGNNSYANTGGYDAGDLPGGYGSVPDRELTAEEQEDQDVEAAKSEIKFIKQQDLASTRNTRRMAEQNGITARETLARLGQQGERIHNTEKNLDMASHQNRLANEKARELKTLNRSMFAVHVANPFTAKKREEAADAIALEKHQRERNIQEATRKEAYGSQARQKAQQRDLNGNVIRKTGNSKSLAERAKYQFEADSEDEEIENELDDNLDAIYRETSVLNQL